MASNITRLSSIVAILISGYAWSHSAPVSAIETQQEKPQPTAAPSVAPQNDEEEIDSPADSFADTFYGQAYALYQKKKYRDSIALLDQAIAENIGNADLYSLKSYCHAELKEYEEAMLAAKQAIANDPEDAGLYDLLANNASFLKDTDTAIENYRRSLDLNERNARVYNNYLSTLKDQKRWEEVKQVYARFEKLQNREEIDEISRYEGDIHFYASVAYQETGENASALGLLDKAIEAVPDFAGYYVNRGIIRNDENNFTQALVDLNKAIELDSKDILAYFNRGNTFLMMENYGRAIKDFLKAKKMGKQDESVLLNLGNAYEAVGKYSDALEAYNDVLKINPENSQVKNNLAILYSAMGDADRSNNAYRQAQQSDQRLEIPLYNQAVDLMKKTEFDKAIVLLEKALTIRPDFQEAYNQLGICYLRKQQYLLAAKTFSEGIELYSGDSDLYANRALVFSRRGDFASAEKDYLQALKHSPSLVSIYGDLAGMFQDHGDMVKAKYYFDLAEQAGVESQDYYVSRVGFLLRSSEFAKAVAFGVEGLKRYPNNATLMLNLANAYQEIKQIKKAVKLLEHIINIDPENSVAQHNLGNIYYHEENNCRKAIDYFRASIDKDGSRIEPYLSLAGCYESLSQYEDADNAYRQLTEKFPNRYEAYYNRANFYHNRSMAEKSASDFERSFALMDNEQASSPQSITVESNQYVLLKANAYQAMRRFKEASAAYQRYLSFNKSDASAYVNYAYCLIETGDPQAAILQFETSYALRSDEIDVLIGLFATNYLLNDAAKMRKYRRLAEAKLQRPLSLNTLDELSGRGYFYSDKFRQVWRSAVER